MKTESEAIISSNAEDVSIRFSDILSIAEIQTFQDLFSAAVGVASIITHPDGSPITRPSNFSRLCKDLIRKTEIGLANCYASDALLGRKSIHGATIQKCLSCGLWDACANITVGGVHVANWLIGQVRNDESDKEKMIAYADEIGIKREEFETALSEVPVMSGEQFRKVVSLLHAYANELSERAYQNLKLKQQNEEHKKAAEALRESESFNRRIIETANEGIWALDIHRNTTFINQKMAEMLGYSQEEILKKKMTDFIFPDDLPDLDQKRLHRMEGKSGFYERRFRHKSNNEIWAMVSSTPLWDQDGNFAGSFGMMQDITDRKKAEISLLSSETKYRLIAENTSDAIALLDMDMKFTYCSPAVEKILGYTPNEAVQLCIDQILTPGSLQKVKEKFEEILPGLISNKPEPAGFPPIELEEVHKNGSHIWVELTYSFLKDMNNNPSGIITLTRDITERRQAEENLRQSEARFRNLLQDVQSVSIQGYGPDGTTQYWNKASEVLYGYSAGEAIGRNLVNLIIPAEMQDHVKLAIEEMARTGEPVPASELTLQRKDGSLVHVFSHHAIIKVPGREQELFCIDVDLTGLKKAEVEIRKLNEDLDKRVIQRTTELEAAIKELETFSYSVSHDLKAPLRHINGFIGLFLENLATPLRDEEHEYLDRISEATANMDKLIDALLSFSRLNKYELRKSMINSASLVAQVIRFFESETQNRNISFTVAPLPDILGDEELILQVWMNLISNAIKYTGKKEEAVIEIGCEAIDGFTRFYIKDNGAGFNMKYAEKLFGVFQRLHKSVDFEGVGIGLANVNRIIRRHGGQCQAEGQTDQGATFYFTIPC